MAGLHKHDSICPESGLVVQTKGMPTGICKISQNVMAETGVCGGACLELDWCA